MHGHARGHGTLGDRELETGRARARRLLLVGRPENEEAHRPERLPEPERLRDGCDAERARARIERGAADIRRPVPVAVRLDDGPQLGAVEHAQERPRVAADRTEVERQLRAGH